MQLKRGKSQIHFKYHTTRQKHISL